MPEEFEIVPPEERAGATLIIDDGRNWTAWHVWEMNSRRRISNGGFQSPPDRPLVSRPTLKKKRGKK